jgi:putative nucleotidyltransferase with HDIG domain
MTGTPSPFGALRRQVAEVVALAQKAEKEGNRAMARGLNERAIRMLTPDESEYVPALIRRVARSYIDDGMFEAALDCLAAAQHLSRARGDTAGVAHAFNLMGIANLNRGDLESAEALYNKAQALAEAVGDLSLEAMVSQNLGIAAGMRGRHDVALRHWGESLAAYRSLGLSEYVGLLLSNMGMAHASLEHWDDAQRCFDEALTVNASNGDAPVGRVMRLNLADMLLQKGEDERAAAICDAVFADAVTTADQRALGEASKLLGVLARRRGDHATAERLFDDAHRNAMAREDLLLAAETAREQAELFELMGRNKETLRALGQAHQLYKKLQATGNLADLAAKVQRLETRFYDTVNRWAQTIESKDPYTLGHCERVAEYACGLAREVGLDEITMFWFRIGALLHDVGKIEVPTEILTKAGPLNDEERRVMERHAAAGAELLKGIDFPWDVLPMIRNHHERWDGSGYPDKLSGESIPLTARVLCIADVFDALASDRPYRRGFPRTEALTIMQREVGKMFDPRLFEHFMTLVTRPSASAPLVVRSFA